MMFAAEYAKELRANLARIKSFVGDPLSWLEGREDASGWGTQTVIKTNCTWGEAASHRVHHAVFKITIF
jgi:hypothetical protein